MKTISIIGTVGLPATYGGFETLVEYITKHLSEDYNITVYCSSKSYKQQLSHYNGATLKYINLHANGIQSVPYDILSIANAWKTSDTLLILGVSGCLILPFVKLFGKKKIVVNIDGLEWKRQKWKSYAKKFLKFSEFLAVKYADVVITDNKVIQDYVQREYGKQSELIAYGADHVNKLEISNDLLEQFSFLKHNYAFSVCRIEPENNIHVLLNAFEQFKKLTLAIIGNWSKSEYGQQLKENYSNVENIILIDPIYDQTILDQIRSNCYLYLHGHSAGGTNPSLVEAMYLELPILAFDVSYNRATTEDKALYFHDHKELIVLLEKIVANQIDLQAYSTAMYHIAKNHYTWEKIASQYASIF